MFIVNVVWICQTKKLVTYGVSKIYKWILRDTQRCDRWWVKLLSSIFLPKSPKLNVIQMSQSQKIFTFGGVSKNKWILRHMFRLFHFLSLWQMMPKIIHFFFMFIVNVTWISQTKIKSYIWGLKNLWMDT